MAFTMCENLGSIVIPYRVAQVGAFAFQGCSGMTNATIGNNVAVLYPFAFAECSNLTSITIPSSVKSIGDNAFYNSGLRTIMFEGNAPNVSASGFLGTSPTAYYLPGTTGWTEFTSKVNFPVQLWDSQIQIGNPNFGLRNNQFGFNITGTSNLVIVVEACANPVGHDWTPLQTNVLTGTPLYFADPNWANYGGRFYRLHWP